MFCPADACAGRDILYLTTQHYRMSFMYSGHTRLVRALLFCITLLLLAGIGWHLVHLQHFHPGNEIGNDLASVIHTDRKFLALLLITAFVFGSFYQLQNIWKILLQPRQEIFKVHRFYIESIVSSSLLVFIHRGLLHPKTYQ